MSATGPLELEPAGDEGLGFGGLRLESRAGLIASEADRGPPPPSAFALSAGLAVPSVLRDTTPANKTTTGGTQKPVVKDAQTDSSIAWALIEAFEDIELKRQLGKLYKERTANQFYKDWVPYFGTADRVSAYFSAIRAADVPGDVHLHEAAASRLEMVRDRLGAANMPAISTALGLVRGRPTGKKNLLQHHLGLAIDLRALANPKIADRRLKTLIGLHTGKDKAHYMDLGDYTARRRKIKQLGKATAAAYRAAQIAEMAKEKVGNADQLSPQAKARVAASAIDPESKLGKEGAEFYEKIASEHKRVADASSAFRDNLPPAVQAYLDLRRQKGDVENEVRGVDIELKKAAASKKRLKKGAPSEDVDKELLDLETKRTVLLKRQSDIMKSIADKEKDMPTLFSDWIEKIDLARAKLQESAGSIDLSALPSPKALKDQQAELVKQQRAAQQEKKELQRELIRLRARIAKMQKRLDVSGQTAERLTAQLDALSPDAPKTKAAALRKKVDAAEASRKNNEELLDSLNEQVTAVQGSPVEPGDKAERARPTLQRVNKKLADLEKQLKSVKERSDLLPKREEFDRLEDLKRNLSGQRGLPKFDDPKNPRPQGREFVFKGKNKYSDPSVIQVLEKGYMNPDEDVGPGKTPDSRRHGFNQLFFKTMAEFGFELGAAWESADAMHFELVEGLDLVAASAAPAANQGSDDAQPTEQVKPAQRVLAKAGALAKQRRDEHIEGSRSVSAVQRTPDAAAGPAAATVGVRTEGAERHVQRQGTTPAMAPKYKSAASMRAYHDLVRALENQFPELPPRAVLTLLRTAYYGQPWSVNTARLWASVLPSSPNVPDPRTKAGQDEGSLFEALRRSQVVDGIDIGHLLTGLEAMLAPTESVSLDVGGLNVVVAMPNVEFATWGGDLGSAAAMLVADHLTNGAPSEPKEYFEKFASSTDLEGNIDAYALRESRGTQGLAKALPGADARSVTPFRTVAEYWAALMAPHAVSELLAKYYLMEGPDINPSREHKYSKFIGQLGGSLEAGKITNRMKLLDQIAPRVQSFAEIYLMGELKKRQGASGVVAHSLLTLFGDDDWVDILEENCWEMVDLFLDWLEKRAAEAERA